MKNAGSLNHALSPFHLTPPPPAMSLFYQCLKMSSPNKNSGHGASPLPELVSNHCQNLLISEIQSVEGMMEFFKLGKERKSGEGEIER